MSVLDLLRRIGGVLIHDERQITYAQCGEDLILKLLFDYLGIARPTYLDIGAHHPTRLSNTYFFYKKGSSGVCVEPSPALHKVIAQSRPRDICLNIGIGSHEASKLKFYVLDEPTLSTFSEEVAQEQVAAGRKVTAEFDVALEPINQVIEKYLQPHPNLVSLDTEGFDLDILQNLDFSKHRPEVFCIETLTNIGSHKIDPIFEFMAAKGYAVFADTFINTIFVEATLWKSCRR